jgi:hypothetical protein
LLVGLAACRFVGPTSDPAEYVASPEDATAGGPDAPGALGDDDSGSAPPSGDAPGGGELDGGGSDAALDDSTDASCAVMVAMVMGCDPVRNTGCNPFQQCDIAPPQTTLGGMGSMLAGQCVFGAAEAGVCTSSILSESCPPKSTCVDGGCQKLCFCNADCPVGQCCSDRSGPSGFSLCGACP